MNERPQEFSWNLLGNIALGRPNLGPTTRLEAYRLMQFTLRTVLEHRYGAQEAGELLREAGLIAGRAFAEHVVGKAADLSDYLRKVQSALREYSIGVLRMEEVNLGTGRLVLTIDEDLDCSGLPELSYEVCQYDEGFFAGLLEASTGKAYHVTEVDCWCTGARTCRFVAEVVSQQ